MTGSDTKGKSPLGGRLAFAPVLGCLVSFAAASGALLAQAPPASATPAAPAVIPREDANRPIGPSIFPIYDQDIRTEDNTRVLTLLGLYHATRRLDRDDASRLLLPFFYWQRRVEPPDRRLYLFPLLYFHRSSPQESFTYVPPLFYQRRTPEQAFQVLFPLWWYAADLVQQSSTLRVLFPLLKLTTDRSRPDDPQTRARFGLRWFLEFFESSSGKSERKVAAFNLFNWKEETDSGLALFRSDRTVAPDGIVEERTFLFPLYGRWKGPDRDLLLAGPLFGLLKSSDAVRRYFTPLVWVGEGDGGFRSLLLFPFFHRSTREEPRLSYFASYPFYTYRRTAQERRWGILFGLAYANSRRLDSGKTSHSVLFPLGHFEVEPDGSRGHRRFLPFYFEDFNPSRRWRFVPPLYWNLQQLSGQDLLWDFTFCLPTYVGWGAPRDYFATGFPLYWSSRSGARGWDLLIPLFYGQKDATSRAFYSVPLTYVDLPSQKAVSVLAGGITHRRFYDLEHNFRGWGLDMLWWLWGVERRDDGFQVRALPLFWTARDGDDHLLLLFPLWLRQWSPQGSHNYFFPVYGRYRSQDGLLRRDFYALGAYAHTVETDPAGALVRDRDDVLWSLISAQRDLRSHMTHRRAIPLFWQTRSVNEDRTLVAPFYYSHRIESQDETYRLKLVLGNVFLSKSVERDRPPPAVTPPVGPVAPGPPRDASAPTAPGPDASASAATPLVPRRREIASEESGVLWPLSRFGHDNEGNPFEWVLPFYYHARSPTEENRTFFPLAYLKRETGSYHTGYFRYFFLFDRELFDGGHRVSVGQLLADWLVDRTRSERRLRLLYPVFETRWSPEGSSYQFTPIFQGEKRETGGERRASTFFFPFYFKGHTDLRDPAGGYATDSSYFYLFPLYGRSRKSLRTEYEILIPFLHLRNSLEGYSFQARPIFSLRNDPEEFSVRLWPLHSLEAGEGSGEWWVGKYLYLSKLALRRESFSYRLDPFLFHVRSSPEETRGGGLFGLAAYHRQRGENGAQTSWRALPLAYGYSRPVESGTGIFPLIYARDFGPKEIDYVVPWRFFFLTNRLRGKGEHHFSLLWKLAEYTGNSERPDYHDFRMLEQFVVERKTETSRQLTLNPFFNYIRDDVRRLTDFSLLFSLYRYQSREGLRYHTLLWFIRLGGPRY